MTGEAWQPAGFVFRLREAPRVGVNMTGVTAGLHACKGDTGTAKNIQPRQRGKVAAPGAMAGRAGHLFMAA